MDVLYFFIVQINLNIIRKQEKTQFMAMLYRRDIKNKLKELFLRTLINFEKLKKKNIELQNYALNPGKGNYENYIELMIQEINDKKLPGFYDEIYILNKLKTFLKNIYDSLSDSYSMDDFKIMAENELKKYL